MSAFDEAEAQTRHEIEQEAIKSRAKLLDKIRKVLALSTSPNEHEAARAAERVQAMLAEHNLSMDDLREAKADGMIHDHSYRTDSAPWRRPLGTMVAWLYFCGYFYAMEYDRTTARTCGYIRYDAHNFIGAPHNVVVARSVFQYLDKAVARLAIEGAGRRGGDQRSQYITSFRVACSQRLCKRIGEMIAAAKAGQAKTEGGTNLPALLNLYEQSSKQVAAYVQQKFPGVKPRKTRATLSNRLGAEDGARAGDRIGLSPQMTGKASGHLIGN